MPKDPSPSRPQTDTVRLAMLGMIEGNGHPYSWSAIINNYDREKMAQCPFPVIPKYLGAQPSESVRVPGAQVTHIWTDNPKDAELVSAAALIPKVVAKPEDVIGQVDGVVIATDDGFDHVRRARLFVEAGIPVFIDKPLALTVEDLRTFIGWQKAGAKILSSSGLRFAPELDPVKGNLGVGDLRMITGVTVKTWERYGIHMVEPIAQLLGPGFVSVRLESQPKVEIAHIVHRSGAVVTIPVFYDAGPTHGYVHLYGTGGYNLVRFVDTYTSFRRQMVSFVDFVRAGGKSTYPFSETVEFMALLIAGIRSRAENSRRVEVAEIQALLS